MKFKNDFKQIFELTGTFIKSRYQKTLTGSVWLVVGPTLMFGAQAFIFKNFLNLKIDNYYLFLVSGLMPWLFLSQSLRAGPGIFFNQSHILKSGLTSPSILVSSIVLDNFIHFIISFLFILLPLYLANGNKGFQLFYLCLAFIPLLLFTYALTLTMAKISLYFRDLEIIAPQLIGMIFFLTPIIYPRSYVPLEYRWIIDANPANYILIPFRSIIYSNLDSFWKVWGQALLVSIVLSLITLLMYKWKKDELINKL